MEDISLQEFGLTKNEEKVYLTLLGLGSVGAGILIRKTGLHRAAVYDNIDILAEKGLVSYVIKANRKYFFAENPDRFSEILDRRKEEVEKAEKKLNEILPILESKRALLQAKHEASIYEGKKGLKSICEDILKEANDFLVFGAQGGFQNVMGTYFWNFHRRRSEAGINMRIIYSEKVREEKFSSKIPLKEMRFLSREYETPATTWIYASKVAIILWSEIPVAFLIRSKEVSDSYRQFFGILWKEAKK